MFCEVFLKKRKKGQQGGRTKASDAPFKQLLAADILDKYQAHE